MQQGHLKEQQLTDAQKAICEVAMILACDLLQRDYVEAMPVVQSGDIIEDFRLWVPAEDIPKLWEFWHAPTKTFRLDILVKGATKRRQYSELKCQMVAETQAPGASVSIIARRHDVNSNQLFRWRRQLLPN